MIHIYMHSNRHPHSHHPPNSSRPKVDHQDILSQGRHIRTANLESWQFTNADRNTSSYKASPIPSIMLKIEEVLVSPSDANVEDPDAVDEEDDLPPSLTAIKEEPTDYKDIETELGITEYMSPSAPGFSAVVKARYSDFLVHEVRLDGVIARLTSRDLPETTNQRPVDDLPVEVEAATQVVKSTDNAPSTTASLPDEEWNALQSQLAELIHDDDDCAQNVMALLKAHSEHTPYESKFVTLPALDKAQRTSIHKWIRESLHHCARADTLNDRIRIWHATFEKEMPNYEAFSKDRKRGNDNRNQQPQQQQRQLPNSNKRNKKSWPEDRPEFLQFVLYKENIDTTTAAKELSRKGSKARIGYAGMKDKRGVTAQFCTMQHTEPQQILGARQVGGGNSKHQGNAVVQIGNFEYVSKEMRLGTLKGNRFDLVLRNVLTGTDDEATSKQLLQNAADSMKEAGFINYFGTQRFGKYQDTHLTGIAVLKGDFRKAIDIFMSPKPDDRPDAARGRLDWQNRFKDGETPENEAQAAKRIVKCLTRFMTAENSAMQSLSRFPLDYRRAFRCIPKTLRMMFLHAVQSLVWNRAASHRIKLSKTDVLAGDLVMVEDETKGSKVHVVSEVDIERKQYSIVDVVLPLIGTKSEFPTNEMGDLMKQLLQELGVSVNSFKEVQDNDLALQGDYRKLLVRPSDFTYDIKEYFDPKQPLLQTDLMALNGEDIVIAPPEEFQSAKIAMIVGFTLPSSSYATVALRELMKKPTSSEYQKDLKLE